jgi:hypothetical protein
MRRVSEHVKIDVAISPVEATSSKTSAYFNLKNYDRALFAVNWTPVGASAIVTTTLLTLYQAKNGSAATSAAAITGATAICSTGTKMTEFTITPQVCSPADTVAIVAYDVNGDAKTALTFTASNGGTSAATASTSRLFSVNDTASGSALISNVCTTLAAILNETSFGVPGLYASAGSTMVTCRSIDVGDSSYTVTSSTTTNLTMAATKCIASIEINASSLTLSSSFTHVAVNVAHEISAYTSAICVRAGRKRISPVQMHGAIDTTGE